MVRKNRKGKPYLLADKVDKAGDLDVTFIYLQSSSRFSRYNRLQ